MWQNLGRKALRWGLAKLAVGHPFVLQDYCGKVLDQGDIKGLALTLDWRVIITVGGRGQPMMLHRRYTMTPGQYMRWDYYAKRYVMETSNVLDHGTGSNAQGAVGSGDDDSRDSQEAQQGADGGQDAPEEIEPGLPAELEPHRESQDRVRRGHDEDSSSEGEARGSDGAEPNQGSGDARHSGAMSTFINDDIPVGFLVCVDPENMVHIRRVGTYSSGLPAGTTIWGSRRSIATLIGFKETLN